MKRKPKKIFRILGTFFTLLFMTIFSLIVVLLLSLKLITSNISISAKELFVTTILETGQMKFLASWFLSNDEIKEIVDSNSMKSFDEEEDLDLINIKEKDKEKIELVKLAGNTFAAKMLIINDPSRVKLATTYPYSEFGKELHELVEMEDGIAGVNGGLYVSSGNKGGYPVGVVVKDGFIEHNKPGHKGLHIIGLDTDNLLRIIDIDGKSAKEVENIIKEQKIRDAVAFQDESSDSNNHFVKLVINGEGRELQGRGSGANPRTAIGQRKDGAILLLVTDGRGSSGHLGATAQDLINIMLEYGAVNAANLDGGSSSSMYYNDKYEMTSVTLYYSNSSWRMPNAFIIEKR